MPEQLVQKRENRKIEDLLMDDARRKKEKIAELEKSAMMKPQLINTKVSDKYILQKFKKQFKTAEMAVHGDHTNEDDGQEPQGNNHQVKSKSEKKKLNYLQYKDFMISFGLLTPSQA